MRSRSPSLRLFCGGTLPNLPPGGMAAANNGGCGNMRVMVERAKEYIRAGDAFQIVLSQRYEADFPLPALRALSLPAPDQPGAGSLWLSRFRGLP